MVRFFMYACGRLSKAYGSKRAANRALQSRKQTAHLFGLDDTLDADSHGGGAMRNLVFLRSSDYLRKRMLKDAEKFVGDFAFRPQKRLQTLYPLEVRKHHTPRVAQDIGNDEYLIPSLLENEICRGRGRSIGGFCQNAALQFRSIFFGNDAIHRSWNQHITSHGKELVRIDMVRLIERFQVSLLCDIA